MTRLASSPSPGVLLPAPTPLPPPFLVFFLYPSPPPTWTCIISFAPRAQNIVSSQTRIRLMQCEVGVRVPVVLHLYLARFN